MAIGNRVRAKVVKNKVAAPFKKAEFDIMFNGGISLEGDLLDMAAEDNIVQKSGAWFNYGPARLGQGRENSKQFLKDNPDLLQEIRGKVLEKRMPACPEDKKSDPSPGKATGPASPSRSSVGPLKHSPAAKDKSPVGRPKVKK